MPEYITPARVAALLTALAPFAISTLSQFKTLPDLVQVAVVLGISLVGSVFVLCYSSYKTKTKVVELQVNAQKELNVPTT